MEWYHCICILLSLLQCTEGLQWTDKLVEGELITVCDGDDVVFPWDFKTATNDVIFSVDWFMPGPQMVAFFTHGTFAPVPDYAQRAEFVANGGLRLRHVTDQDAGNYTIEVDGHNGVGQSFTHRRTVVLEVKAPMKAPGFTLPLTSQPEAVHNDVTDTWDLRLSCGNFSHLHGHPSFNVEWTTPSGSKVNSTSYSDGSFHLALSSPLEEGTYECCIPQRYAGRGCLPTNITNVHNVTGHVDKIQTRLALLEGRQEFLMKQNVGLKTENAGLKKRLEDVANTTSQANVTGTNVNVTSPAVTDTLDNLTMTLSNQTVKLDTLFWAVKLQEQRTNNLSLEMDALAQCCAAAANFTSPDSMATLTSQMSDLETTVLTYNSSLASLQTEMHLLEGIIMHDKHDMQTQLRSLQTQIAVQGKTNNNERVTFHVQLASNAQAQSGATLVLSNVYNNEGDAYNKFTGVFVAPRDGTYFFIASTGSHSVTQDAYLEIIAAGTQLATAYAHRHNGTSEMATCHGLVALKQGQQVYLVSLLNSLFNYADTFFTGFLIN